MWKNIVNYVIFELSQEQPTSPFVQVFLASLKLPCGAGFANKCIVFNLYSLSEIASSKGRAGKLLQTVRQLLTHWRANVQMWKRAIKQKLAEFIFIASRGWNTCGVLAIVFPSVSNNPKIHTPNTNSDSSISSELRSPKWLFQSGFWNIHYKVASYLTIEFNLFG